MQSSFYDGLKLTGFVLKVNIYFTNNDKLFMLVMKRELNVGQKKNVLFSLALKLLCQVEI